MQFLSTLTLAAALFAQSLWSVSLWADEPININTANAQELAAAIDGVGVLRAERIVDYREQFGPFTEVDDLVNVEGIGEKTLEANRTRLRVE
ncbi:MAG: ComEA family DNA-binding protein [Pseudomonadota bacterium]